MVSEEGVCGTGVVEFDHVVWYLIDDNHLGSERGEERSMLRESRARHTNDLGRAQRREVQVCVQLRLVAAEPLVAVAQVGQLRVDAFKLLVQPQPCELLAVRRVELPQVVVFQEHLARLVIRPADLIRARECCKERRRDHGT
jgi:hypothetical protein